MAKFRVNGTTIVDIYVEVEADTLEEAIEKAEDSCTLEEYTNGTMGVESYEYDVDVCANGWIEWHEDYSEMES